MTSAATTIRNAVYRTIEVVNDLLPPEQALLGHDKQSCDIIDTIKDRGASTPWAEKIAIMVKTCHP